MTTQRKPWPDSSNCTGVNKSPAIIFLLLIAAQAPASYGFHCPRGDPVTANLGGGVIMRTCLWQNEAGVGIRVGPFELIKNGVLIVKTQTNIDGQLHGRFTSWSDDGVMIEDGHYQRGHKHGPWREADADGKIKTLHYHEGALVQP